METKLTNLLRCICFWRQYGIRWKIGRLLIAQLGYASWRHGHSQISTQNKITPFTISSFHPHIAFLFSSSAEVRNYCKLMGTPKLVSRASPNCIFLLLYIIINIFHIHLYFLIFFPQLFRLAPDFTCLYSLPYRTLSLSPIILV